MHKFAAALTLEEADPIHGGRDGESVGDDDNLEDLVPWIANTATFRPLITAGIMALWSTSCQGKRHRLGTGGYHS